MLKTQIWKTCIVCCAGWGVFGPPMALAAPPTDNVPVGTIAANSNIAVDVLAIGGHLQGEVVSPQGQPRQGVQIVARRGNEVVASTWTDASGRFDLSPIRGGEYSIATSEGAIAVRAWSAGTAPPSTQNGLMVVAGDGVMRSQGGQGGQGGMAVALGSVLSNPWVLGTLTAGAVILPLALDNSDASGN